MEFITKWFTNTTENIYIGFEDIKYAIERENNKYIIINTMSSFEQECLIYGTIPYDKEEHIINNILENHDTNSFIILIYGKNSTDESINKKYKQLKIHGIKNIYIYSGGLFEWLLLQDIFGISEFPTTKKCKDILKYKSSTKLFSYNLPRISL